MLTENFKRHENKYIIPPHVRAAIERAIDEYMQVDEFGESTITSAYFDDADFSMISRSNEKPLYKEKLRFRVYGSDAGDELVKICQGARREADSVHWNDGEGDDDFVFAELKKKYKGIVYKRRVPLAASSLVLDGGNAVLDSMNATQGSGKREYSSREWQIGKEVQACFDRHGKIAPSVATICERVAYRPKDDALDEKACELRFTFDSDLRYVDLSDDDAREIPELADGMSIMEIKCVGSYPIWLAELLSEQQCYSQSFSKCGTAVASIRSANSANRETE